MAESDTESRPRWLDSANELARVLFERAEPVAFGMARTPSELDAVFQLRYRVSIAQGWRLPEDLPGGFERDEYDDEHAAQIVGWVGTETVATARVVFPNDQRPLPTEEAFDLIVDPPGRVVDAGRAIVAPEYRDGSHRVLGGLSAAVWMAMSTRGYHWAAVAGTKRTLSLFEALGFEVTVIGEPRSYWGEERYPARFGTPNPEQFMA
ncbi:MAG: GNAT family N-acyltransferase [Acidimicrobiia bacterium]